jgi:hypothetical protein
MRPLAWPRAIPWIVLAVALAACGAPSDEPLPYASSEEALAPGMEELGPMPQYHLSLTLDAAEHRLAGRQQVIVPNRTDVDLDEIVFRLYPNLPAYGGHMGIGPVWVNGERGTPSLRAGDTSLVIPLPRPLGPESSVTISMTFDIEVPQRPDGYVLFGHSQGVWSLPDAYPLLAVHDGSAWHEDIAPAYGDAVFAEVAFYDVTLTLPPTLTLAATGALQSDTPDAEGQRVYRIVGGPLREFTWLASPDYQVAETTAHGTLLRSFYLPGDEAAGQATLNIAAAALRIYTDTFGPYPFAQMLVVEAPLSYFGMEYSGLNLIGVDLYREHRAELEDRLAHEIAHQWWYAQVGNDQINTPWLDEGLAEYSMAIYYREVYGQARVNTLVNQRWLVPYQVLVEDELDAIVNQPAAALGGVYEVIVYGKAALFFDAVRQKVGDETLTAILREYVDCCRWQIATPYDFLRVAESVSGQDLDALYNHWILSKR